MMDNVAQAVPYVADWFAEQLGMATQEGRRRSAPPYRVWA